jgi:MscS family membrane protein
VVVALFGFVAVLAALGYPVGTLLAGLGIGGIAVALGAQKTLEHFFGSLSIAVDQPFRVGDFVKGDTFQGTIETIGLRTTRIRTLERSVVAVPNGRLADMSVENFGQRDRFRMFASIGLTYDTTAAQMAAVRDGFERVLRSHPKLWPEGLVVRFGEFGAYSLNIEVQAFFAVPDFDAFREAREEVLLGFMQVVEEAKTGFAFPTQTVHVIADQDGRKEQVRT